MDHHIIAAYAQVAATAGVGLLQLGIVGRWLWRNGKALDERRRRKELEWAEGDKKWAEGDKKWAEISQGLKDTSRMLGEALAQSRARRARTAGGSHD